MAPATGALQMVLGGVVRGEDAEMSALSRGTTDASTTLERHSVLRAPTARSQRGGYWVLAGGAALVQNPRCGMTALATVVDRSPGDPVGLDGFALALTRGQDALGRLVEPATRRLLVVLGRDIETIRVPDETASEVVVEVPPMVWWAAAADPAELETLAFHVAALHRLADSRAPFKLNAALAAALREAALGAKGTVYAPAWRGEVKSWQRDAERCGSWRALIDHECPG
jgi:hypothetical protein